MTLSVCCLTAEPGPQVAAMLRQLRPVADEIVVAADARAELDQLHAYASVADRLLRVEVAHSERSWAWLHAQCGGDWVLRVDGDELAGPSLIDQLPELISATDVHQYLLPRRWLYPDPEHWLDEPPWWPDYQVRLLRNDDLVRFRGEQHTGAEPVRPARYLDAPLLHLEPLLSGPRERLSKALRYEARRPGLTAPGGGLLNPRFYLPERHARRAPAQLDPREAAAVREVLNATIPAGRPDRSLQQLSVVPLAESDRQWAGRTLPPDAYRAAAEPLERDYRMTAGEQRPLHFRITNRGSETWPWDADVGPPIRASYRWRHLNGALAAPDGLRTPFPSSVRPGEAVVVPLEVVAPAIPGRYLLEVDVVHEWVRWFGCEAEPVPVRVEGEREAARLRRRLPASAVATGRARMSALRRRRSRSIPRTIHRIWLGDAPLTEEMRRYAETWRQHHPDWRMRLWGDAELHRLVPKRAYERARHATEASDLLRYEILRRFGGVYVDTDVECRRPLDPLLEGVTAFAAWEVPDRAGTAILGCTAGHPAFEDAARHARETVGLGPNSADATGPAFLTIVLAEHPEVTVFDSSLFYPYRWDEPRPSKEALGDAYAVHHWNSVSGNGAVPAP